MNKRIRRHNAASADAEYCTPMKKRICKYGAKDLRSILRAETRVANERNAKSSVFPPAANDPIVRALSLLVDVRDLLRKPIAREYPAVETALKATQAHLEVFVSSKYVYGERGWGVISFKALRSLGRKPKRRPA